MTVFARVPGLRVEAVGGAWAAFSPASGETLLLNDTSAAILEVLAEEPLAIAAVADRLAADSGVPKGDVAALLADHWPQLVEAGLVRQAGQAPA